MLPNTAPGAGLSTVPQVNQAHLVVSEFADARCATFRRELTTICTLGAGGSAASALGILNTGVIGAGVAATEGVGGVGSCPSVAGLQPDLMASVIFERVCNSDTQAALSYRLGIFD